MNKVDHAAAPVETRIDPIPTHARLASSVDEDTAWTEYLERSHTLYDEANYSSPVQRRVMHASHKLLEKAYDGSRHFERVLELGAGSGEHLAFVRHSFDEYVLTDIDPQILGVARTKVDRDRSGRLTFETQAAEAPSYPDASFDRVLAVHVLEHISQPHLAIKRWRQLVKPQGVLSILIPTDPGLAWRLGRHLGPRRGAHKRGISYDYVMAREHINSCHNLIALLRHYFPGGQEAWWPLPVPSVDMNLFFAFHAIVDRLAGPG